MLPAVQRIRAALEDHGCQTRGPDHKFRAQCPAHEGTSLSLSVSQGPKGALVHCFPGCKTSDVCEAVKLDYPGDLFDTPPAARSPTRRERTRTHARPDPYDELRRILHRTVDLAELRLHMQQAPATERLSADERVELAEWGEQEDQDAHFWRVLAKWAALACDEKYVRDAYQQRAKWMRTRRWEDKPSHEQDMVLVTRAEDLRHSRRTAA